MACRVCAAPITSGLASICETCNLAQAEESRDAADAAATD